MTVASVYCPTYVCAQEITVIEVAYTPPDDIVNRMTDVDAQRELRRSFSQKERALWLAYSERLFIDYIRQVNVLEDRLEVTLENQEQLRFFYHELPNGFGSGPKRSGHGVPLTPTISLSRWMDNDDININWAKRTADALYVLKQEALSAKQESEVINEAITRYANISPKPPIPEEARRFVVQAMFAIEEKRFTDARRFLREAVKVAPWSADNHYNLALTSAELKRYPQAIASMRRFLLLERNSPDARAVQDMIYRWESVSSTMPK